MRAAVSVVFVSSVAVMLAGCGGGGGGRVGGDARLVGLWAVLDEGYAGIYQNGTFCGDGLGAGQPDGDWDEQGTWTASQTQITIVVPNDRVVFAYQFTDDDHLTLTNTEDAHEVHHLARISRDPRLVGTWKVKSSQVQPLQLVPVNALFALKANAVVLADLEGDGTWDEQGTWSATATQLTVKDQAGEEVVFDYTFQNSNRVQLTTEVEHGGQHYRVTLILERQS